MARKFGCIGKCTLGLSVDDFHRITQNIESTLNDKRGRKMLRKYLEEGKRRHDLECIDFYEKCSDVVSKEESGASSSEQRPSKEFSAEFETLMCLAADLNGIEEITRALLVSFREALKSQQHDVMMDVIRDAMISACNHLRKSHDKFSTYAQQPCPRRK